MAAIAKFVSVRHGIEKGLETLRKWYKATDDTNVYFVCLGECDY